MPTDPHDPRPSGQCTLTLHGRLQGFDADLAVTCDVRKLAATVAYLQSQGLEAPARPLEWSRTPEGLPLCPRHGVPMRQREKQGDTWHSHPVRTADGTELYCRGYPGKDSPGYYETDTHAAAEAEPAQALGRPVTAHARARR